MGQHYTSKPYFAPKLSLLNWHTCNFSFSCNYCERLWPLWFIALFIYKPECLSSLCLRRVSCVCYVNEACSVNHPHLLGNYSELLHQQDK